MIQIGARPVGMKMMGLEEKSRIPSRGGDSNGFMPRQSRLTGSHFPRRQAPWRSVAPTCKIRGAGGGWMCPRMVRIVEMLDFPPKGIANKDFAPLRPQ